MNPSLSRIMIYPLLYEGLGSSDFPQDYDNSFSLAMAKGIFLARGGHAISEV
jgi:hypothetical protein